MDGPTGRRSKRKREPLRHDQRNDGDPDNCPAKRSKRETRDDLDHGRHCMIVQQAKSVANRNRTPRRISVARQNLQEPAHALPCSRSYPIPFDGRTGRSRSLLQARALPAYRAAANLLDRDLLLQQTFACDPLSQWRRWLFELQKNPTIASITFTIEKSYRT